MLRAIFGLAVLALACSGSAVVAAPATWSSGDLGNNVINTAGDFSVFPNLTTPSNTLPAELVVKYGLWNSPNVSVDVFFNGNLVGNFVADQGYINPGPEFAMFDVTGLLLNGLNTVFFTGNNANSGDYVVGQVDVNYDDSGQQETTPVPEPTSLALWLLIGTTFGICTWKRRRRGHCG